MSRSRFLHPRYVVGAVAALGLFVIFNLTRPPLETEMQARFALWYGDAANYLSRADGTPPSVRKINATIRLSSDPKNPGKSSEWILPTGSLEEVEQRTRLARVLELIKESQVYGKSSYLITTPPPYPHLAIVVTEGDQSFAAFAPVGEIEQSIQIKNLLKLLEIFSANPALPTPQINPNQL